MHYSLNQSSLKLHQSEHNFVPSLWNCTCTVQADACVFSTDESAAKYREIHLEKGKIRESISSDLEIDLCMTT